MDGAPHNPQGYPHLPFQGEGRDGDGCDALERRVQELLGHLDEMPAIEAALPFTVAHLVSQLREAVTRLTPSRPYRRRLSPSPARRLFDCA